MKVSNKRHLQAAFIGLLAGALMGCGATSNTARPSTGLASAGGGGTGGGAAATGSGITGGATGASTVNVNFAASNIDSLLANLDMLSTQIAGASLSPTRIVRGTFGGGIGVRAAVIQGYRATNGQLTLLAKDPNAVTPGQGNIILTNANTTGVDLINPFDLFADTVNVGDLFATNNFGTGNIGSLVRITGITTTTADIQQVSAVANLFNPISIARDGTFVYVAEFGGAGVGQIRRFDLTDPVNPVVDVLISGLQFPSSLAMDTTGGRRTLYVAINNAPLGVGQGGVLRLDLTDAGVDDDGTDDLAEAQTEGWARVVTPQEAGAPGQHQFPFDLAIDDAGNVVVCEGGAFDAGTGQFTGGQGFGRLRVIERAQGDPGVAAPTSRLVLQGDGGPNGFSNLRGPSVIIESPDNNVNTVFFVEGVGQTSTLRQVTFNNQTGAIFRHLILHSGEINPLDTEFDPIDTINVKYSAGSNTPNQGRVIDVR